MFWHIVVQRVVIICSGQIVTEPSPLFHCSFVNIYVFLGCFTNGIEDPTQTKDLFVILSCVGIKCEVMIAQN